MPTTSPLALDVPPGREGALAVAEAVGAALDGSGPAVALVPAGGDPAHVARVRAALAPDTQLEAEGIAAVVATSGSTGDPVGVLLGGDALRAAATAFAQDPAGGSGRWIVAVPVTSVGGLLPLVRARLAGHAPVVWPGVGGAAPFTAEAFRETLREALADDGVPVFCSLVPTQLARLLEDPEAVDLLARLTRVVIGAAALPLPLRDAAFGAGVPLVSSYGSTETCGGVVYDGRALPGVQVRVDEDGRVLVGGTTLAAGYRLRPDLTAEAFRDGWFRTSDLGALEDGVLRVTGRMDDVVKVGGAKVALPALVAAARTVPGVRDAAAFAIDDEEWGHRPVLVVVGSASDKELLATLASSVGPTRTLLRRADSLPYLPNGKIDRVTLRTDFGGR